MRFGKGCAVCQNVFPRVIPCVVIGDGGVRRTRITRTVGVALVSPVLSSSGMVQCPVDPAGECEIFERSQFDIPAHIQVSGTGVVRILIFYEISHRRILPCDIFVIDLAFLIVGIPQRESGEGAGKRVFHAGIQITNISQGSIRRWEIS